MDSRHTLPAAAVAAALAFSVVRAEPLSLAEAQALAERANAGLAAERLQVPVAKAGIGVARQRPNPELAFEETRETPRDALGLTFPIETGGKRGKRIDVAEAAVATSEATLTKATIELRARVRRAYSRRVPVTRSPSASRAATRPGSSSSRPRWRPRKRRTRRRPPRRSRPRGAPSST
jgi:outer membrane protein TolC